MVRGFDHFQFHQGLALHLPFDEGTGTVVRDASPYHHSGSFVNTPAWVTLPNGVKAVEFLKADQDRVNLGNPTALRMSGLKRLSISGWIYPTLMVANNHYSIVSKTYRNYMLTLNSNPGGTAFAAYFQVYLTTPAARAVVGPYNLGTGAWLFVCGTFGGNYLRVYLGTLTSPPQAVARAGPYTDPIKADSGHSCMVGGDTDNRDANGRIKYPSAWRDVELSPDLVTALWDYQRPMIA